MGHCSVEKENAGSLGRSRLDCEVCMFFAVGFIYMYSESRARYRNDLYSKHQHPLPIRRLRVTTTWLQPQLGQTLRSTGIRGPEAGNHLGTKTFSCATSSIYTSVVPASASEAPKQGLFSLWEPKSPTLLPCLAVRQRAL